MVLATRLSLGLGNGIVRALLGYTISPTVSWPSAPDSAPWDDRYMKFVCDACGARYHIDDKKVAGKVLRIRCKKCSHVITVREPSRPSAHVLVPAAPAPAESVEWFYSVNGETLGPYDEEALLQIFHGGAVGDEAYVWHTGFGDWKAAIDVPVFSGAIVAAKHAAKLRGVPRTQQLSAVDVQKMQLDTHAMDALNAALTDGEQTAALTDGGQTADEPTATLSVPIEERPTAALSRESVASPAASPLAVTAPATESEATESKAAESEAAEPKVAPLQAAQPGNAKRDTSKLEALRQGLRERRERSTPALTPDDAHDAARQPEQREPSMLDEALAAESIDTGAAHRVTSGAAPAAAKPAAAKPATATPATATPTVGTAAALAATDLANQGAAQTIEASRDALALAARERSAAAEQAAAASVDETREISPAQAIAAPSSPATPVSATPVAATPALPADVDAPDLSAANDGAEALDLDELETEDTNPDAVVTAPSVADPAPAAETDLADAPTTELASPATTVDDSANAPAVRSASGAPAIPAAAKQPAKSEVAPAAAEAKTEADAKTDDAAEPATTELPSAEPATTELSTEEPATPDASEAATEKPKSKRRGSKKAQAKKKKAAASAANDKPTDAPAEAAKDNDDADDDSGFASLAASIAATPRLESAGPPLAGISATSLAPAAPTPGQIPEAAPSASLVFQVKQAKSRTRRTLGLVALCVAILALVLLYMSRQPVTEDAVVVEPDRPLEENQLQVEQTAAAEATRARNMRVAFVRAHRGVGEALTSAGTAQRTAAEEAAAVANNGAAATANNTRSNGGSRADNPPRSNSDTAAEQAEANAGTPTNEVADSGRVVDRQLGIALPLPTPGLAEEEEENDGPAGEHFAEGLRTFVNNSIVRCNQRHVAEEGLLEHPRVELSLTVQPSGRVSGIELPRELRNTAFGRCLQTHRERWTFPSFRGSAVTLQKTYVVQ